MKFTVTGITTEENVMTPRQLKNAEIFSGKNAGICYMGDSYFDSNVTDADKALKRFKEVASRGHHSIADHVRVEVLLEGVSKMLAIVLNSLQDYATSEKSGRYTDMGANSDEERALYLKWVSIFRTRILSVEPDIDDEMLSKLVAKAGHDDVIIKNGKLSNDNMSDEDECHQEVLRVCKENRGLPSVKLAQENARYVLSVFTRSTTMGYSTSIRQWNYIYDWCNKYMERYHEDEDGELVSNAYNEDVSYFEKELYKDIFELADYIKRNLYVEELRDNKGRCFEFLTELAKFNELHPMGGYFLEEEPYFSKEKEEEVISDEDHLGLVYNVSYTASFVQIAQAERHRTLKYFMLFNPDYELCKKDFFIPEIIRGTAYEDEWLDDLMSIKNKIPQATMVGIVETGHIADFALKCQERLCGRAQWEIMNQTKKTAERFVNAIQKGILHSPAAKGYASIFSRNDGTLRTKCDMCGKCLEPCRYGKDKALDRIM